MKENKKLSDKTEKKASIINKGIIFLTLDFLFLSILLSGCATSSHLLYAKQINKFCQPRSCLQQAFLYADFLGKDAKVMSNGKHAFVVKENRIYDSTNPSYSGRSVDNWRVRKVYKDKKNWRQK